MRQFAWRPVVDNQRSRPEVLLSEIISKYAGHVVVGRDLDVYEEKALMLTLPRYELRTHAQGVQAVTPATLPSDSR